MERSGRCVTAPVRKCITQQRENLEENGGGALEKFIAQELGNEPFKEKLNAASFCYMSKEELHELLDKILESVNAEKMESIYVAEDKAGQIVEFLQILLYEPNGKHCSNFEKIRCGIEEAEMGVLMPLMAWLLANMPTLKMRAYLSKFLTKIKVPDELLYDQEFSTLYTEYQSAVTKFKTTHKLRETMLQKRPLMDLKRDTFLIQQDINSIKRKIALAKAKVTHLDNKKKDIMLEMIGQIRIEKEEREKLSDQEVIEMARGMQLSGNTEYLETTLSELEETNESLTPRSLLACEQQEVKNARQIVSNKLPKAIGTVRRKIRAINTVLQNPPRSINDLEKTRQKIQAVEVENTMLEKNLELAKSAEVSKDILITRKKAECVRGRCTELDEHKKEIEEKYESVKTKLTLRCVDALAKKQRDEDDQFYVKSLRAKAKLYKEKKNELHTIRTQLANLYKMHQNVNKDLGKSREAINDYEQEHGMGDGCVDLGHQEEQESFNMEKVDDKNKELLSEHSEKVLEKIKETVNEYELKIVEVSLKTKFKLLELERANNDEKNGQGRMLSFKDRLLGSIVEQERVNRDLILEKKDLELDLEKILEQQVLYSDLIRILKFKKKVLCMEDSSNHEEEN